MTYYTSRAQDAAEKVKQAQAEVERADAAYRKGAGCDVIAKANSKLAAAHAEYQRVVGGRADDR
ncbi:hypothetical protein [Bradyrhizobium sp. SZCCHNR3003]|uniref:hypothetical protein n=1 Tax=Bradyrhizobium sp. SZCCHNR3003 TaxID=3057387 RepID=UPI002915D802|nr:hypothetical protein [Bradyrhizobium sp. SZCCHNR3003]